MAMPATSGLDLVGTIRTRHPNVATVMLTSYDGDRLVEAALDGGVYGYVTKPFAPSALVMALGWTLPDRETLRLASVLHDVGKIGVPDAILLKPGELDPEERRLMETHPSAGHAILAGAKSDLLRVADTIAWTHHERMDGSGYPRGLAGTEIPVAGRIAAVADVFDALTSDRPYRSAFSERDALEVVWRDRGTKFDTRVVDALLAVGV